MKAVCLWLGRLLWWPLKHVSEDNKKAHFKRDMERYIRIEYASEDKDSTDWWKTIYK